MLNCVFWWGIVLENEFKRLAQTLMLREGVCQNLSFQNIFGGNFCGENLDSV